MSAQLVAVAGPSGAGKDTLMALAAARLPGVRLARRVITRPASAGGEDFDGVSPEDFAARLAAGDFALHWQAHGLRYAVPRAELAGQGQVLFNASRAVLAEAAQRFPGLRVILVSAPPAVLAARLAQRGREDAGDQARRLGRAGLALPEGLDLREVVNDTSPEAGLVRFAAALQDPRG